MKRTIRAIIRRIVWFICRFIPVDNKKIVFSSYYGKGYGDNPKYIAEELIKNYSADKLVWLVNDFFDKNSFPKEIIQCKKSSIKGIFHLTTAKIWIDNCRKSFFYKKKNQYYIQTWHGFALKRIEKDVEDKPTFAEIWDEISPYISGQILVGHNIQYDTGVIKHELKRYGLYCKPFKSVCTCKNAKKFINKENISNYKLDTVCDYFGISMGTHHDARDDTDACRLIFNKLIKLGDLDVKSEPLI